MKWVFFFYVLTKSKKSLDSLKEEIESDLNKRFVVLAKPLNIGFCVKQDGSYKQLVRSIKSIQSAPTQRSLSLLIEYTEQGFVFQSDIL